MSYLDDYEYLSPSYNWRRGILTHKEPSVLLFDANQHRDSDNDSFYSTFFNEDEERISLHIKDVSASPPSEPSSQNEVAPLEDVLSLDSHISPSMTEGEENSSLDTIDFIISSPNRVTLVASPSPVSPNSSDIYSKKRSLSVLHGASLESMLLVCKGIVEHLQHHRCSHVDWDEIAAATKLDSNDCKLLWESVVHNMQEKQSKRMRTNELTTSSGGAQWTIMEEDCLNRFIDTYKDEIPKHTFQSLTLSPSRDIPQTDRTPMASKPLPPKQTPKPPRVIIPFYPADDSTRSSVILIPHSSRAQATKRKPVLPSYLSSITNFRTRARATSEVEVVAVTP